MGVSRSFESPWNLGSKIRASVKETTDFDQQQPINTRSSKPSSPQKPQIEVGQQNFEAAQEIYLQATRKNQGNNTTPLMQM